MLDRFCAWAFPEPDPEDPNYPWLQHAVDPKHVVIANLVVLPLYGLACLYCYLH